MGTSTAYGCLPRTLERLELAARTVVLFPTNAYGRPWSGVRGVGRDRVPPLAHLVLDAQWVHTHDWSVLVDSAPQLVTIRAASEIWIRNYLRNRAETLEQVRV